eukprot:7265254-Prymnesium_polylepis.2
MWPHACASGAMRHLLEEVERQVDATTVPLGAVHDESFRFGVGEAPSRARERVEARVRVGGGGEGWG